MTFLSVLLVLSARGRAQVRLAVVKPIAVGMIDEHILGNREHLTVHVVPIPFTFLWSNRTNRVEGRAALDSKPFEFGKPKIIIRADDGVLTLGKWYPAESVAVAQTPI